jgi:hypothetical protein
MGEVWIVSGLDESLEHLRWRRFATGLNQPLGLRVVDGVIHVLGRDQITRLHDVNGDGEADFYECFSNAVRDFTRRTRLHCRVATRRCRKLVLGLSESGTLPHFARRKECRGDRDRIP